jgi:ribose-phosphate pyrophosphokinase
VHWVKPKLIAQVGFTEWTAGCKLTRVGNCVLERFPDREVAVQILECVRRKEVFLMQPTSPPTSDHLIELLTLADACRRAGRHAA